MLDKSLGFYEFDRKGLDFNELVVDSIVEVHEKENVNFMDMDVPEEGITITVRYLGQDYNVMVSVKPDLVGGIPSWVLE